MTWNKLNMEKIKSLPREATGGSPLSAFLDLKMLLKIHTTSSNSKYLQCSLARAHNQCRLFLLPLSPVLWCVLPHLPDVSAECCRHPVPSTPWGLAASPGGHSLQTQLLLEEPLAVWDQISGQAEFGHTWIPGGLQRLPEPMVCVVPKAWVRYQRLKGERDLEKFQGKSL